MIVWYSIVPRPDYHKVAQISDNQLAFKAKPFKESRKSLTAHALVIVCMVTSATSILVLDGLSTQAVVQALERHAARYGMPGELHVDSGSFHDYTTILRVC
jgi:hypothetical protein